MPNFFVHGALTFPITLLALALLHSSHAVAEDAAAFQAACAGCHPAANVISRRIKGDSEEERRAFLTDLLKRHHPPDPAATDRIIGFLLALPVK
jgi:hypothetical protein